MNKRPPTDGDEMLFARLEQGAADLDAAAEQYARRRTAQRPAPMPPRRSWRPAPAFGALAACLVAASLVLVGVRVMSERGQDRDRVVVAAPVPASQTDRFPFVGLLTVSLPTGPSSSSPIEPVTFRDGRATGSNGSDLTITSAVTVDIDADGTTELALLVDRDGGVTSKAAIRSSMLAIVETLTPNSLVATSSGFGDRIDALVVSGTQLSTVTFGAESATASVQPMVIEGSTLSPTKESRQLSATELPSGDQEIRFATGTTSGMIRAAGGKRTGWFKALAGQVLRIERSGVPAGTTREVTIRTRAVPGESGGPKVLASSQLPDSLTVVLPIDGSYEIAIGDGTRDMVFELGIDNSK